MLSDFFAAEKLKYRHTSMKWITVVMPLVTVFLTAWLTHIYFAVDSYNWWYTGLYPGFLGIVCSMIGGKDMRKKNYTIWSLPCSMKKIWDAKILVGGCDLRRCHGVCSDFYDCCGNDTGKSPACTVYFCSFPENADSGRDHHMADHAVGDSFLPVSVTENGNLSDAGPSYGILCCLVGFCFFETLVRPISGSYHRKTDVSCSERAA